MFPNSDFILWNCPINKTYLCLYVNGNHKINIKKKHIIKFKKINNILYSNDYHVYYDPIYLNYNGSNISHLLKKDFIRVSLSNNNSLNNPKLLFISLCPNANNDVTFGIFNDNDSYKWMLYDMNIINLKNKLYLNIYNNKLILSKNKCRWQLCKNSFIKNITYNLYLSCDLNYNITVSKNIQDAIPFHIENNSIHYIKPSTKVAFEINNLTNSIDVSNITQIKNNTGHNIGILLAAGTSSRFVSHDNKPKQLYHINNLPIIIHSINAMINVIDQLIIVTNSKCIEEIRTLTKDYTKIIILVNDVNCRLESIGVALNYIKNNYNS